MLGIWSKKTAPSHIKRSDITVQENHVGGHPSLKLKNNLYYKGEKKGLGFQYHRTGKI